MPTKTCDEGHTFEKASDCPTCPICEAERAPRDGFLARIGAPARRALEREGIATLDDLTRYSRREILDLHGVGPSAIPKLEDALHTAGLDFVRD